MTTASVRPVLRAEGTDGKLPRSSDVAHARFLETRVFGSLDGLRALSILAVVWHHVNMWHHSLWAHAQSNFTDWSISQRGFLGVDLFFIISGFLIVTLLLRERRRSGDISRRSFYIRRFLRIFPAYYLMLVVVVGSAYLRPGTNSSEATHREWLFAALYLSNLVPMASPLIITWSLATEEQFYLVVPTLEKRARRVLPALLPVLYVLVSLPALGFLPGIDMPVFFRTTTFGPILLGVMLAHVLDSSRGYRAMSRVLGHRSSSLLVVPLVVLALVYPEGVDGWARLGMHWALLMLVAASVIREDNALAPGLSLAPIRRVGVVSYGIYLYHGFALAAAYHVVRYLDLSSEAVFFVAAAAGSWLIAEVSYRLYESRFLALKGRFGGTSAPGR
jgi:peptidoglycan/LPS O-acetylase OafA/YrhL